jgi:predicted MPP superfamily phosphohydrolase
MSFGIVLRVIFVCLLLLSVVVGRRIVQWSAEFGKTPTSRRNIRLAVVVLLFLLNLPVFYFLAYGIRVRGGLSHQWQLYFLYPYFAWQITALTMAVVLSLKTIVTIPMRVSRWWKARHGRPYRVDESRRQFLGKTATALPAALFLTSGYGIYRAQTDFDWFEHELKISHWPRELSGLRVMQISDMHVGSFMSGEKLKRYIADINKKPADLLMLTGDIIDHNIAFLPECMEALATLKIPRYGAYVCIGNHDYYSGGADEIFRGVEKLGMITLKDASVSVPVRDARLTIAGIDYPWREGPALRGDQFTKHVEKALALREPLTPTIMLAHHPHAFDEAARHDVSLTLAGHTHGGQFAFHYPGGMISLGDLMFRYVAGLYAKGDSHLYVNRGLGNWFPVRLGAPPEVTILTLV